MYVYIYMVNVNKNNNYKKKRYYEHSSAVHACRWLNQCSAFRREIDVQMDPGYQPGREFGRSEKGGQVLLFWELFCQLQLPPPFPACLLPILLFFFFGSFVFFWSRSNCSIFSPQFKKTIKIKIKRPPERSRDGERRHEPDTNRTDLVCSIL